MSEKQHNAVHMSMGS